jgi:hypothetical protein
MRTTDEEREAAMRAGCRIDIRMPGGSNKYDAYALDENGDEVDRIESFVCDECEDLVEWGECGPIGAKDGRILECAGAVEKHLVTWLCSECADAYEDEDG